MREREREREREKHAKRDRQTMSSGDTEIQSRTKRRFRKFQNEGFRLVLSIKRSQKKNPDCINYRQQPRQQRWHYVQKEGEDS